MEKFSRKTAEIEAVQVTADNVHDLAVQHGGSAIVSTEPYTGQNYVGLNVPTLDGGGFRVDEGDYLVRNANTGRMVCMPKDYFEHSFEAAQKAIEATKGDDNG